MKTMAFKKSSGFLQTITLVYSITAYSQHTLFTNVQAHITDRRLSWSSYYSEDPAALALH